MERVLRSDLAVAGAKAAACAGVASCSRRVG